MDHYFQLLLDFPVILHLFRLFVCMQLNSLMSYIFLFVTKYKWDTNTFPLHPNSKIFSILLMFILVANKMYIRNTSTGLGIYNQLEGWKFEFPPHIC